MFVYKWNKVMSLVLIAAFAFVLPVNAFAASVGNGLHAPAAAATESHHFSTQERELILATPEYIVLKTKPLAVGKAEGVNQSAINAIIRKDQERENYLLSLSDAAFKSAMQASLNSVIRRIKSGEKIAWNKYFVETMVKSSFPGLYDTIASQESNKDTAKFSIPQEANSVNTGSGNLAIQPDYSSGSLFQEFSGAAYSAGIELFELDDDVSWSWNNTGVLTSVTDDPWQTTYWSYTAAGITADSRYPEDSTGLEWVVAPTGEWTVHGGGGVAYIGLDIYVYANGGYSTEWTS